MVNIKYNIQALDSGSNFASELLDDKQNLLVSQFEVNSEYNHSKNYIRLEYRSIDGNVLKVNPNVTEFTLLQNAQSSETGASILTLEPEKNIKSGGFEGSDVILNYHFLNNPLSKQKFGGDFFIKQISPDRTEVRLFATLLNNEELTSLASNFIAKLKEKKAFTEFYLSVEDSFEQALNVKLDTLGDTQSIVVKLAKPLPGSYSVNTAIAFIEEISETVTFQCTAEVVPEALQPKRIAGPNFGLEIENKDSNTTEFFNYNELFSYPVTGSYYELYSLFNEKSAQISIDHTDYSDFIHFSSAEERLRNFKYKLDLLHSYEDSLYTASLSGRDLQGISGSADYYNGLISGVISNFDHYDNYLYFESSSHSWPKSTDTKPHKVLRSTETDSQTWYNNQITVANNYDVSNFDILTNTIPAYLREDSNNEPYLLFIHMIAQHFDNLWIYFKAVSDKYDADNRLNFGISKDLVRDAVETFGVKLGDSNASLENLFSSLIGETYQSGSEHITEVRSALSGSDNAYLQPVSKDAYSKEIYKRIYHNIPLLTKTKGTQRGLRALINCFGIPDNILEIRQAPGIQLGTEDFFGPYPFISESNHSIRLDNSGSIITGSTLSQYSSARDLNYKYTEDSHEIHVGFNINKDTNERVKAVTTGSFNIDEYIGDPRLNKESEYIALDKLSDKILSQGITWEEIQTDWEDVNWEWQTNLTYFRSPKGFIRLLKFFDNSLFKVVKDFVPARAVTATGLIIEPHVLNRSKAKAVEVSFTNEQHTGSIKVGEISGSDGDSFPYAAKQPYTTDYSASFISPLGRIDRDVTGEQVRFTGEYSGSFVITTDGEVSKNNPLKKSAQPILTFNITSLFLSDPLPPSCNISLQVTYEGDEYSIHANANGLVSQIYPTAVSQTSTFDMVHDYDDYQFATIVANPTSPYVFEGWYTAATGGTLISNNSTLNIYSNDESTYGTQYYARFSGGSDTVNTYYINTAGDGTVTQTYPTAISATGSFSSTIDYSTTNSFILQATPISPESFTGWFTSRTGGTAISTDTNLTVMESDLSSDGSTYFARFTGAGSVQFFRFKTVGNGQVSGTYPTAIPAATEFDTTTDFGTYASMTVEATPTYPYVFQGWFTAESGGTAISTNTTLTITETSADTNGTLYYARFS